MPKVTQEHLDARREQILEGARRAFAAYGYDGATVARLEEETGLSRGAIFHYFENKQDLFVECAWAMTRRFGDILVERGLDEAVRAIANENPEWLGVLIEAQSKLRHDDEFVRRLDAKAGGSTAIGDWFEQRQAEGALRDDISALELGRFASSVVNGLALRVAGQDAFDVDAAVRLLNDALAPR